MKRTLTTALIVALASAAAPAAVTDVALYELGEAGTLGANNRPQDSVGGHHFLSNFNTNSSVITDTEAMGSTEALHLAVNSGFYNVAAGTTTIPTDDFGVSLWVRTGMTQTKDIFMTNQQSANSLKISQVGGNWGASLHGTSWIGPTSGVTGSVVSGEWAQIAVIRDGGNYSFYIDGIQYAGSNPSGTAPSINLGQFHLGVQPGGGSIWVGDIDELRIFSFTTGAFERKDLGLSLINGSFEPDADESTTAQAWTLSGNVKVDDDQTSSDGLKALAFNGGNSTPNGVAEQTFNTQAGQWYMLTFDFGKFATGSGTAQLDVDVFDAMVGDSILLVDGQVSDASGANTNATVYDSFEYWFKASGSMTTLRFTDTSIGTNSFDAMLDNIGVVFVPAPAALPAGLALIGLMAARRRRR